MSFPDGHRPKLMVYKTFILSPKFHTSSFPVDTGRKLNVLCTSFVRSIDVLCLRSYIHSAYAVSRVGAQHFRKIFRTLISCVR